MSKHYLRVDSPGWLGRLLGTVLVLVSVGAAQAQNRLLESSAWEPRVPVGKCLSSPGTLLSHEGLAQPWRVTAQGDALLSRDVLLALPGVSAALETPDGAVELRLWGNLPDLAGTPSLQSAVILHDSRAFDLDFTLLRGRVVLTNRRSKGPAGVWLRLAETAFQLTLSEPGDQVVVNLYGRWPHGVPFHETPRPGDGPGRSLTFVVVKGQASLKSGDTQHLLSAPPGRSSFRWDNVEGPDLVPQQLPALPDWAAPPPKEAPARRTVAEIVADYQKLLKDKTPAEALLALLTPDQRKADPVRARLQAEFAVFGLAALHEVGQVVQLLSGSRDPLARNAAVVALRHWIGDRAGRDLRLYRLLVDQLGYPSAPAATVLQLLHSPFAADQPETYETLIAYLRHENPAIRALAWWHLLRLAPSGSAISYDPVAPLAEREKGYAAWKKLIPSGTIPKN
jgi:hypothetical protein